MLRILAALLCLVSAASAQDIGGGIVNTGRGGGSPSGTLTINTTPISGGSNGLCLYDNNGFLSEISCSPLTAGTTPTAGIVSGNVLGSTSNVLVDTGVPFSQILTSIASGVTPATGFTSGNLVSTTGGTLTDSGVAAGAFITRITAGTTPTTGFVDSNIIESLGGVVVDSGLSINSLGTVTSISAGCGSTTGTGAITTAGTIVTTDPPVTLSGANVPIIASYCGETIYLNNGSNQIPTIAQAGSTGFPSGWYVDLCNIGAGTQTLTPTTSTIGGAATYVFAAGSAAGPICTRVISDGTNYKLVFVPGAGGVSSVSNSDGTLTISPTTGAAVASLALAHANTWTGAQTFGQVLGGVSSQSGTTYTFAQADCGTDVRFTSNSAVTATIPTTLTAGCHIGVIQRGTAKVSVNGTAVSACTLTSAHSYTGTSGTAGSVVGIIMDAANTCILTGDGS